VAFKKYGTSLTQLLLYGFPISRCSSRSDQNIHTWQLGDPKL
jgi:hypothetical protein